MLLRKLAALCIGAAVLVFPALASAQTINGLSVKDGAGAAQSLCTYIISSTYQLSCYAPMWYNGSAFVPSSASNPLPVAANGAANSFADGWNVSEGAKADAACGTDNGTCGLLALIKRTNQNLTTLTTQAQTGVGNTGSAVPASAVYMGAQSNGNLTGVVQAAGSAFLNMTTATTTKIVTGTSSKKVYVTNLRLHAGGTTTAKFVEGTGTNCGTGTADLSETWDFAASDGMVAGNGLGPVLVMATAGDDVCVTNSAAQNLRVGVAYETH